eukprot:gene28820-biopygen23482
MFFSSESAINILNDLLQYEHIEAGTFHLSCDLLNIANVLENKFGWAHVMASQKGVIFSVRDTSISTEFDDENGLSLQSDEVVNAQKQSFLYIDIYRIEQVIRNLITNAMKFTPSGGTVSVDISCELFSSGNGSHTTIRDKLAKDAVGYFRVAVTDSGAGLSVDEQNNLFGEFTQFNKNELQGGGGSGLGLWISRHIIDTHKDDSSLNCKVVAKIIEGEKVGAFVNAIILTADDGTTAMEQLRSELSGKTRVTGNALPEDIESYISSGANQVITKPLSRAKLMDALNRFLPMAMAVGE